MHAAIMVPSLSDGTPLRGPFLQRKYIFAKWGKLDDTDRARQLLVDLDYRRLPRLNPILARIRRIGAQVRWASVNRSRNGWHLAIGLNRSYGRAERIAMQLLCGSDFGRETHNLRRHLSIERSDPGKFWKDRANIFFSEKLSCD